MNSKRGVHCLTTEVVSAVMTELSGVMSGVTMSVGQAAAAAATAGTVSSGPPLSATVKVLGPSTLMKHVKDTSSSGSVLASRTGTAVVSLQPVLIRPGTAVTVASASQTNTIQASVVGAGRSSTGLVATSSASTTMPPGVQQAVHDIVQQAQAQAARQNFVTSSSASCAQQPAAAIVGSPPPPSASPLSPVTAIHTATDAAAAATSQNKSSPYVMRLRNQKS